MIPRKLDWQDIAISKIKPYKNNPKLHPQSQVDLIAQSLTEYGWTQPICVDKDYTLIFGHCRLLAAKQLGEETVPVVFREDLSPAQVKALRILDNKSNESEWDTDLLEVELAELQAFDYELEDVGFESWELSKEGSDPAELWKDMPEFIQEDNFYQRITITFFSENDVKEFAKLVKQEITPKTKYLHFPEIENFKNKEYHYGT